MMRLLTILLCAIAVLTSCVSTVPPGYDADTTPDHDGESWIGGQP